MSQREEDGTGQGGANGSDRARQVGQGGASGTGGGKETIGLANDKLGGNAGQETNVTLYYVVSAAGLGWFQVPMYVTSMWMHSLLGTGCFYIQFSGI